MTEYSQAEIQANRAAWVSALRSGEFRQTWGKLCRISSYGGAPAGCCCLGVAAEVLGAVKGPVQDGAQSYRDDLGYNLYNTLPATISKKLGLSLRVGGDPIVRLPAGTRCSPLSVLNDSLNYSFDQIADIIEAQGSDWDGTTISENED